MRERSRPLIAALTFLTAVPIGRHVEIGERDLRRGAVAFPLVGAAVGMLVAAVAWAVALVLPPFPASVLGVAAGVAVTAAFHLDGLGDLADGIGATLTGRDPAEVMRDPRLGTFGVAAVALDLLLRASLLAALVADGFPWAVVAAATIARVAPIALAWRLPYVGGGTGGWAGGVGGATVAAAGAIALVIGAPSARLELLGMVTVVAGVGVVLGRWGKRRLGGVTGDVFGAAAELGETLSLLVAAAWT